MTSWIAEVETASPMICVDLLWTRRIRIRSVWDFACLNAGEDRIETLVIDEEGVVLHLNFVHCWFSKLDERSVIELYE